ncbi:LysM peptidoglycan-binding domain-containing protein [Candidatus Electronema sp. TJ]|uniref:lytic transglycosylase n=1 Tax=Candidatus Electronema sp. TJ TaxID=3401573 RepID=UPI003AA9C002
MKKTKKVVSYIMLLVPLALPAGCSTVSGAGGSYGGNDRRIGTDDESEQLRLIVERYFEKEERQRQMISRLNAATPSQQDPAAEEDEASESGPTLAESPEELKEELEALEKTGSWTIENVDGRQAAAQQGQCQIAATTGQAPQTGIIEAPNRPEPPLVSGPLPQPAETAAQPESVKNAAKRAACDFPVLVNRQVQFYLDLYQGKQRKHFSRWLERSALYMSFITAELEKAGLPVELAYLAMIESGFDPVAYSPSHASGLWQFVPSTGRNFGLRVDSWADERRDPEKSTKAAAAYLKALYRQFGDWHLAVAAYNAGEGAVARGLKRYSAKNFWELASHDCLRLETKRYVPQMIAAVLIARNPAQYGFRQINYKKPSRHELVRVPSGTSLKTVAASGSLSVEQLRKLNKDLLTDQVPEDAKGGWLLKVPAGRSALVAANLPKAQVVAVAAESPTSDYISHKVAKNETLGQLSKKYDVSLTALLKVNSLRSAELKVGQSLRIPVAAAAVQQSVLLTAAAPAPQAEPSAAAKVMHKLGKGETLSDIGKKYSVSVADLMKWNKIAHAGKVKTGQSLTIQLSEAAQITAIAPADEGAVALTASAVKKKPGAELTAATPKEKTSGLIVLSSSGKRKAASAEQPVSYYKVRSGDSLWSISKKLEVSAGDIKNWNRLNGHQLQPGTTLVIKNG